MLDFLSPELFDALVWGVIVIGGVLALRRLVGDLTGPPRWPRDDDDLAAPPDQRNGDAGS